MVFNFKMFGITDSKIKIISLLFNSTNFHIDQVLQIKFDYLCRNFNFNQENEDNIDILPIQEAQSQVQKSKRITTKYMTKCVFKSYKVFKSQTLSYHNMKKNE